MMGAHIDVTQGFFAWNLPESEQENEIPYKPESMEALFWPLYLQLFTAIGQHKDTESLLWHVSCLDLLKEQVHNLIAELEPDDPTDYEPH